MINEYELGACKTDSIKILLIITSSVNNNNNNNNHGSTALYGLGPPLSEVTWSCAFVAVAVRLNPDVTARAIWQ
jgi:hypothetical protein